MSRAIVIVDHKLIGEFWCPNKGAPVPSRASRATAAYQLNPDIDEYSLQPQHMLVVIVVCAHHLCCARGRKVCIELIHTGQIVSH